MVEEYKVAKCRVVMMCRDSQDEQVRHAGITTRSGRKWAADTSVAQAESMLKLRDIIGMTCTRRQALELHISNTGGRQTPSRGEP